MEYAVNLKDLNLAYNSISDIKTISKLQLDKLDLSHNLISDFRPAHAQKITLTGQKHTVFVAMPTEGNPSYTLHKFYLPEGSVTETAHMPAVSESGLKVVEESNSTYTINCDGKCNLNKTDLYRIAYNSVYQFQLFVKFNDPAPKPEPKPDPKPDPKPEPKPVPASCPVIAGPVTGGDSKLTIGNLSQNDKIVITFADKSTVTVLKGKDGKWKTSDGKAVPLKNGNLTVPVDPAKIIKGKTFTVTGYNGVNKSADAPVTPVAKPVPTPDPKPTPKPDPKPAPKPGEPAKPAPKPGEPAKPEPKPAKPVPKPGKGSKVGNDALPETGAFTSAALAGLALLATGGCVIAVRRKEN